MNIEIFVPKIGKLIRPHLTRREAGLKGVKMKVFFVFKKNGRNGFELKVTAGNLSDHQMRLVVTSIGDQEYHLANGCWPDQEKTATTYGLAALIKAAGYIHGDEEVVAMVKEIEKILQEKWDNRLTKPQ